VTGTLHLSLLAACIIYSNVHPCNIGITPELDKRRKYGMLERTLSSHLLNIFGLKGTLRGKQIQNWKGTSVATYNQGKCSNSGDLGGRIAHVMAFDEAANPVRMTLGTLHSLLDELARLCPWSTLDLNSDKDLIVIGEKRKSEAILSDLFTGQSALCMKWITRIILKNLGPKVDREPEQLMRLFHPCMASFYDMQCTRA
jgi:DNA ligase N terminus